MLHTKPNHRTEQKGGHESLTNFRLPSSEARYQPMNPPHSASRCPSGDQVSWFLASYDEKQYRSIDQPVGEKNESRHIALSCQHNLRLTYTTTVEAPKSLQQLPFRSKSKVLQRSLCYYRPHVVLRKSCQHGFLSMFRSNNGGMLTKEKRYYRCGHFGC
jgi:hypothetical protein